MFSKVLLYQLCGHTYWGVTILRQQQNYLLDYGFDQQRLIWYVCSMWDDVLSISPSSEL